MGYYLIGKTSNLPTLAMQKNKAMALFDTHGIPFDKIGYGCQVCIEESYRNTGLFKAMLSTLTNLVKNKYSHLLCSVSDDNTVSYKTHTNNGWKLIDSFETTNFFIYQTNSSIIK